jgi:hypothetical protein
VQKGIFYAGTLRFDKMLKVLLFPIFAIPKRPIFKEVPGLPSLTLLAICDLEKLKASTN